LKPVRARAFTRLVPRIRFIGSDPRVAAMFPASRPVVEPPSAARWPGQCPASHSEAPSPQVRPRGPSLPGQASGAMGAQAESSTWPQVPVAAATGPSSRLPEEAHSRGRRSAHGMRFSRQ
jgi:hypothetical protein